MDIKEIIKEKEKMTNAIARLLHDFEMATDMEVNGLSAKRDEEGLWDVSVKVSLG